RPPPTRTPFPYTTLFRSEHLRIDLTAAPITADVGAPRREGLDAFWSIASTAPVAAGYFYSDAVRGTSETRVAEASDVASVREIRSEEHTSELQSRENLVC